MNEIPTILQPLPSNLISDFANQQIAYAIAVYEANKNSLAHTGSTFPAFVPHPIAHQVGES
jgi:hypothetical protein